MKPVTVNAMNATILIISGLYGYFGVTTASGEHAPTALIPAAFGLVLVILGLFWNKAPKVVSHVVVVLTLVLFIMCAMRLAKVEGWGPKATIFLICTLSNLIALIVFIKSFIDARKNRTA
jgi:hypothetical protein